MAEHKAEVFVASTFESLSQDMARGQGEHLASLATMMGVTVEHQPAFFSLAQDRYRTLMERGEEFAARSHQGNPRDGGRRSIACPQSRRDHEYSFSTECSVSAIMRNVAFLRNRELSTHS